MRKIDRDQMEALPGIRLTEGETFHFRCHQGLSCFNRCCRNLNLFLYPYDVIRLKARLGISSDEFLDRYVDVILRPGNYFPDVLLRMRDDGEKTCPFLRAAGCGVYPDRPDTCRFTPLDRGILYECRGNRSRVVYFFRPFDFCLGQQEDELWTPERWARDQGADAYQEMTVRWAEIRNLFQENPWGLEGPEGAKAKMAFMAAYNMDRFRAFVFESSFLKRYKVAPLQLRSLPKDDEKLLLFGFAWIKLFVWRMPSKDIRPR
jgi:uncharacterized protein